MTSSEFTDILAISQMTPGPVGINTATYAGYTAVVNSGMAEWQGVLGSLLASFAVILLPVTVMIIVFTYLSRHKDNKIISTIFQVLRYTVVGLIAAAALLRLAFVHNFFIIIITSIIINIISCITHIIIIFWLE